MKITSALLLSSLSFISFNSFAKEVKLVTAAWPPYVISSEVGSVIENLKSTFAKMGDTVKIYVSDAKWQKIQDLGKGNGTDVCDGPCDGYFPEYFDASLAKEYQFSKSMGESPVGLVINTKCDNGKKVDEIYKKHAPNFSSISQQNPPSEDVRKNLYTQLLSFSFGVVSGYVNEPVLDQMIEEKETKNMHPDFSMKKFGTDVALISRVVNCASDADMSFTDKKVFEFYSKEVQGDKTGLKFLGPVYAHGLFVAFAPSFDKSKVASFNSNLK